MQKTTLYKEKKKKHLHIIFHTTNHILSLLARLSFKGILLGNKLPREELYEF